jgi:AcrR family transcriptional regulator
MSPMESPITLETKWFSPYELKIIRGTYGAMARVGTQQLSLRRIAKELEVSPALLVYHFGSRDDLLLETMHWALAGTVRRIKRKIEGIEDPEEAFAVLIDAVFVSPEENRDFHLIYMDLVQYAVRMESFTGLAQLLREHINDTYAAVIRLGVEGGAFHVEDVDVAARTVRAIVEGGFLQWLQEEDWRESHGELQRECEAALLVLLRDGQRGGAG